MNPNKFRISLIAVCLILLIISLTQVAFVYESSNGLIQDKGWKYFFFGSIVILGGGTFEWLIWLSNPLLLFSIMSLNKNKKKSIIYSLFAFMISLSFLSWQKVLISESGEQGRIISLQLGYYLWLTSMFILLAGIIYYFKKYKPVEELSDYDQWTRKVKDYI